MSSPLPTGNAPVRGPSAQTLLELAWEYPVYKPPEQELDDRTVADRKREALTTEAALAYIAGDDPRPLLVLRECKVCNGTDDALLSRENVDNEKTFLLSRWFHCVKLPVDVLQADHPFHNLFLPEKDPPHMFLSSTDGSSRISLESERSRTELWGAMTEILESQYKGGPEEKVRRMEKAIDRFDVVDDEIAKLESEIDATLEEDGAGSRKLAKLRQKLESAQKERRGLFQEIDEATTSLKLRKVASAGQRTGQSGSSGSGSE